MNALGNFTFSTKLGISCLNLRKVLSANDNAIHSDLNMYIDSTLRIRPGLELPLEVADASSGIRFVSCSKPATESLQFFEIIHVFDLYTWITIFLTLCGLAVILSTSSRVSVQDFIFNFWLLLVSLLEQGISKHRFTKRFLFLPLFFVLLLVISNTYKSTNVYNLVSPRPIIALTTFQQLLDCKFKMFSRHLHAKINRVEDEIIREANKFGHSLVVFESYFIFNATSEISLLFDIVSAKVIKSFKCASYLGAFSKHTILHPEVQSKYLNNISKLDLTFSSTSHVLGIINTLEVEEFRNELKLCNNVAILLSWYKSVELGKHAQLISKEYQVNFGKETLASYFFGCYFEGMV